MRLAALFSGGKDSVFAVYDSLKKGHTVRYLISMLSRNPDSYMFHYPNIKFVSLQAKSMGIPLITNETKGEKEKEVLDLKNTIEHIREEIDGIIAGGLASNYQYNRIKSVADPLGLKVIIPFWRIEPDEYWKLILDAGFTVIITRVSCEGLGKEWLGKIVDRKTFIELKKISEKHRFHLAFEGGEAETFVLDCPVFKKSIEVVDAERVWEKDSGFYLFKRLKLVNKPTPSESVST
ncbi:MAG: TIGR00289 family protein [Candidatus Aenigmatarchaeota archaeon]|nr:MAG: TIGR00289 family protein [Candidatus Aenigmarchaeota archaeon]